MGVVKETYDFFKNYVSLDKTPNICELGDQQFMCCPPFPEQSFVKDHFIKHGYNHVSIDLNGEGGALPLDLDKPITDPKLLNAFEIVTNFGTLEHVNNLYSGLKNVHNFCKVNGVMIHVGPYPGNWPNHGNHYLDEEFYIGFSKL